jgi:anti-sigma B factor antagonist
VDHVVIVPPPEIDVATAPELASRLAAVDVGAQVVVDFTEVDFCDSSGLGVLVVAYNRQHHGGGGVVINNVREPIRQLFEVAGLASRLLADV